MAGFIWEKPFPLFPKGFPREVMDRLKPASGGYALGNKAASVPKSSKSWAKTPCAPVADCYTSADSVFQIAAHEEVIPLFELYKMWRDGARILPWAV